MQNNGDYKLADSCGQKYYSLRISKVKWTWWHKWNYVSKWTGAYKYALRILQRILRFMG